MLAEEGVAAMILGDLRRVRNGLRRIDHAEFAKLWVACGCTPTRDFIAKEFANFCTDPLEYLADHDDVLARALLGAANRLAPE